MKKGVLFASIATLTGTIIGAGILALPYVISKSGFFIGILHIIILGLIMLFINLYLGEISLRTKGFHQLTGYASKYLGRTGKAFMLFSMIFGIYSALIAYILAEGKTISFIFFGSGNFSLVFSLFFFAIMSLLVYKSINTLEKGEAFGLIAVITIIILFTIFFAPKVNFQNLIFINKNPFMWFFPYGVVLFSFLAFSALPELEQELARKKTLMKKAIIIGSLIPIALYVLFAFIVVGYKGSATPEIATFALGKIPCFLAVFTMFTAFFTLASALRDMYKFDFKIKHIKAWMLSCFVPLVFFLFLYFLKIATFSRILSLSGSISGGIAGILIVLIARKAKKLGKRKPEYNIPINFFVIILFIILFVFGIIYEFLF